MLRSSRKHGAQGIGRGRTYTLLWVMCACVLLTSCGFMEKDGAGLGGESGTDAFSVDEDADAAFHAMIQDMILTAESRSGAILYYRKEHGKTENFDSNQMEQILTILNAMNAISIGPVSEEEPADYTDVFTLEVGDERWTIRFQGHCLEAEDGNGVYEMEPVSTDAFWNVVKERFILGY